jgi:hypothetical protein
MIQIHTDIYTHTTLYRRIHVSQQNLNVTDLFRTIISCSYRSYMQIYTDTYRYIQIHTIDIDTPTYTFTYIHIHTPCNQCREGFLRCWCCKQCAALPTQIISDGSRGGIAERQMLADGPWAAQGGCFAPQSVLCHLPMYPSSRLR